MMLLDINFYDETVNQGDSVLPFLAFCLFVAGVGFIIVGVVNIVSIWRDFRLFYDKSAIEEKPDNSAKKKKMFRYIIYVAIGIILVIGTRIFYYI